MSAITGIFHCNQEPVSTEHGQTLMHGLAKYPSNDIRTWHNDHIFLGCHAQWITPESVHERLPYRDSQRGLVITADAIIDNRDELFQLLQVEPGRRNQMSDSELILLSYQRWKTDAPKYLVGDFAFMIWDERNQKLFGARDFSGSRTLYYIHHRERFAFCTIIEPLLTLPYIQKKLNEQWLAEYLAISAPIDGVDGSITPYENIAQIPPSHSITVTREHISLQRYCTIEASEPLKLKSNEEYVEAFQEVFQQSVDARLRTFRGVGAHLSGGLDSGSVVSFAVKSLSKENKRLQTFSYVPSSDFRDYTANQLMADESPFIQMTVKHVGGIDDHYLDFKGKNSYSDIDSLLETMEMPYKFFENSFWIRGMFEKAQEQDVAVLLSGARGNLSISWGSAYDHYATLMKKLRWVRLLQELQQYSIHTSGARLRSLPIVARVAFPFLDRLLEKGASNPFPILINQEFANRSQVFNKLSGYGIDRSGWFSTSNIYEQRHRHFHDLFHWNATNTLTTKLSLRHSLWQRDPTNDIRVIRYCLSVPEDQYVQNGLDRALIRRSTEKLLPDTIRLNQRIRGVQGADWVHRMVPHWDSFLDEAQQLSTDSNVLRFMDGAKIKSALLKVKAGARPELATDSEYRLLMRSLIVYRYMKKFA
ncbi:lasso peptide isopeptide bond-forming cyclase [Paenibacillus sp. HWE-109]|uniref:lasso peptide isopeptide bond-forming cyclase n=1 Tax=Paenibacillus sp. HWE-109 TaxID=1306526 RepID=UPI001EDD2941|nr:lasso peptide isopeptide bond-forming cyclase [Paenibacillus sp. HWE-109]UKS24929.1 lasso peptide isopeptide bond-forming cyclase [Paenibacillus sp. HWE-109]